MTQQLCFLVFSKSLKSCSHKTCTWRIIVTLFIIAKLEAIKMSFRVCIQTSENLCPSSARCYHLAVTQKLVLAKLGVHESYRVCNPSLIGW